MLLSMTLMLAFLGMTVELFRKQSESVASSSGRLDAQQNARFAVSMMERELRMAGLGVPSAQPMLVMAGAMGFTFNADLAATDTGDVNAVYINPDADSASVDLLRPANAIVLPTTTTNYPDTTYMLNSSVPSNAETISYWLSQDSTSAYSNEYILFRRANAATPRVVARGILVNTNDQPFVYWRTDTTGGISPVSPALLPLIHTAAVHGSAADTGKSASTDSIMEMRVNLTSVFHDPRLVAQHRDTIARSVQAIIHLMNAELIQQSTCGSAPLGVTTTATVTPAGGAVPSAYVTISWGASVDDGAGEKDVERYAIYRRAASAAAFDQPFASVPAASLATYSFKDFDVSSGQQWVYGVAAQDCTPSSSPIGASTAVTIP
jgi:hypothetical protein